MKATFVELRTKSAEIIRALERKEAITVLYRGKPKAMMRPIAESSETRVSAKDHAAFGMWKDRDDLHDVAAKVNSLRQGRFDAV